MGNCQASEAATVVIERPEGGKVDRIYWSVSASEVMKANPGHYVAMIVASISSDPERNTPRIKQLKLLRPDDTLHIGHVYRLVTFEEVLKEFSGRKHAKLSKMIHSQKQQRESRETTPSPRESVAHPQRIEDSSTSHVVENEGCRLGRGQYVGRQPQWRPVLQSIDEDGG